MKNFEDVNGDIVGAYYGQCWLTYDGRKQGQTFYCLTESEGEKQLLQKIEEIKNDCGDVFKDIYPDQKWVFHFDGV